MTTSISPDGMIDSVTGQVTSGVNDNLGAVALVGGGLLAIGVVWRLASRFVGGR